MGLGFTSLATSTEIWL